MEGSTDQKTAGSIPHMHRYRMDGMTINATNYRINPCVNATRATGYPLCKAD